MQRKTIAVSLFSYLYLGCSKLLVWVLLLLNHSTCLDILGPKDWTGFIDEDSQAMDVCLIVPHLQRSHLDVRVSCAVANSGTESLGLAAVHCIGLFWQVCDTQHFSFSLVYTVGYILLCDSGGPNLNVPPILVILIHPAASIVSLNFTWALTLILSPFLFPPLSPLLPFSLL